MWDNTLCVCLQVEGRSSVIETFKQLLAEEGAWGLTKGLSARIISSLPTSVMIVIGYETLKRLSLRPELVDSRHWWKHSPDAIPQPFKRMPFIIFTIYKDQAITDSQMWRSISFLVDFVHFVTFNLFPWTLTHTSIL